MATIVVVAAASVIAALIAAVITTVMPHHMLAVPTVLPKVHRHTAGLILRAMALPMAAMVIGLLASYELDLPTGAAIVCASGLLLVVVSVVGSFRKNGIAA